MVVRPSSFNKSVLAFDFYGQMFGDLPEDDSQDSDAAYESRDGTLEAGSSSRSSVPAHSTGSGAARLDQRGEQIPDLPGGPRGRPQSATGAKPNQVENVPRPTATRERGRPHEIAPQLSSPQDRSAFHSQQSEDSNSSRQQDLTPLGGSDVQPARAVGSSASGTHCPLTDATAFVANRRGGRNRNSEESPLVSVPLKYFLPSYASEH